MNEPTIEQPSYLWFKRWITAILFICPIILCCFFGISINNSNLLIFQIVLLVIAFLLSCIKYKSSYFSKIPKANALIEFLLEMVALVLTILISVFLVEPKYDNGKYSGASLNYSFLIIVILMLYFGNFFFVIHNNKRYL